MRWFAGLAMVLAIGCGDDDKMGRPPDAPPPPSDGAMDASSSVVSLEIVEGTTPLAGVRVVFQAADSTVIADTMTGADGKASATMDAGGYVTAIDPFPTPQGAPELRTFAGVKPGDQLQLFERPRDETPITIDVTVPLDPNALSYTVSTNCLLDAGVIGGEPSQLQLIGCGPTANLLVETYDDISRPVSSIYKESVALADGGSIDLSAEPYTAAPAVTFAYSNLPEGATAVNVYGIRETALGSIHQFSALADVTAGTAMLTHKVPQTANATAARLSTVYGATYTQHIIAESGPVSTSYAVDGTGLFLPEFTGPAMLDTEAHAIRWSTTGGMAQPDFVLVRAFLNRGGGTPQAWRWVVAAPPGDAVVLPVLPAASPYNVERGDFGSFLVTLGKVPGGYDAVRERVLAVDNLYQVAAAAAGQGVFALLVEPSARVRPVDAPVHRGFTRRTR
jgi:hypothetical protein